MKLARLSSPHMRYAVRSALLIVAVCALESAVVFCTNKPFPLDVIIPALGGILVVPLIIMPTQREKQKN